MDEKFMFIVTVTASWHAQKLCKTVGFFTTTIESKYLEYEFEERMKHEDWEDMEHEHTNDSIGRSILKAHRPFRIGVSCLDSENKARPTMAKRMEGRLVSRISILKSKPQLYW